jgi:ribosomal protein S6--L-glutamate ligase
LKVSGLRLCFLVEDQYRYDGMPLDVVRELTGRGHTVDVLEPGRELVEVSALAQRAAYDAWVLKTVSGGPGLSLLEAAAGCGLVTVNDVRAVRSVRDKAVAAAVARAHGLPCPRTWFAASAQLLDLVDESLFPVVVKPVGGNSGRAVFLVRDRAGLVRAQAGLAGEGFVLVQPYIPNPGVDVKVYAIGAELFATVRASPLHPGRAVRSRRVALPDDLARVAARVGEVFGLDLYGLDVVEGPEGWQVVDVNDFPSFRGVPHAVAQVASTIVRLAGRQAPVRQVPVVAQVA